MVVDFAVEDDDEAAVGRDHRLMADRREIENGETPEAQGETGLLIDPRAAVIRTAMPQRRRHARDARDKRLGSTSLREIANLTLPETRQSTHPVGYTLAFAGRRLRTRSHYRPGLLAARSTWVMSPEPCT